MDNTDPILTDVNTPAEQTTADTSSVENQTPAESAPSETTTPENSDQGGQTAGDKSVPYERFQEVNRKMKSYEKEIDDLRSFRQEQEAFKAQLIQERLLAQQAQQQPEVTQAKQQLKTLLQDLAPELGFVTKQEQEQQAAIAEVDRTHQSLESKYSGKDGFPKYERKEVLDYALKMGMTTSAGLEVAYKQLHESEIMNARLQQMLQQTRSVKTETSNGTGSANVGVEDSDLKKAAQDGDQQAIHTLLLRRLKAK